MGTAKTSYCTNAEFGIFSSRLVSSAAFFFFYHCKALLVIEKMLTHCAVLHRVSLVCQSGDVKWCAAPSGAGILIISCSVWWAIIFKSWSVRMFAIREKNIYNIRFQNCSEFELQGDFWSSKLWLQGTCITIQTALSEYYTNTIITSQE